MCPSARVCFRVFVCVGSRAWRRTWDSMQTESASGCVSNNVLGRPQGYGQGETCERATSVYTRASKSEKFVTKKVGTHVNPADLMTKPLPRPRIEQLMGHRFVGQYLERAGLRRGDWRALSNVKKEAFSWCPCRWLRRRKRHGPLRGKKS